MKHINFFIASLMMLSTAVLASAQSHTAYYHSMEEEKEVRIYFPSEKSNDYRAFIDIEGKYKHDNNYIILGSEEKITEFHDYLVEVKDKFVEWKEVAEKNGIKDYTKKFDIKAPKIEIFWHSSEWFSSNKFTFKPMFCVSKEGSCSVISGGTVKDWDNRYIDTTWYFFLKDENEIQEIIDALDLDIVKNSENAKAEKDNLFK